jgi:hypothetical protein
VIKNRKPSSFFKIAGFFDRPPPGICLRKLCATNFPCLRNFFATTSRFNKDDEKRDEMTMMNPFLCNFIDPSCPPLTR